MATASAMVIRAMRRIRAIDLYMADADVPAVLVSHGLVTLGSMIDSWATKQVYVYGSFIGTAQNGSPIITDIEADDVARFAVGMGITGTGIPVGAQIAAKPSTTSITLDEDATASNADLTLNFTDLPINARFEKGLIAMLGVQLAPDLGVRPSDIVLQEAADGWGSIQAHYMRTPDAGYDPALIDTQNSRRTATFTGDE